MDNGNAYNAKEMIGFFPKQFAQKGFLLYLLSLATVSILFVYYAIPWYFVVMGVAETVLFFFLASYLTKEGIKLKVAKQFQMKLFGIALLLRLVWVLFSYYFYLDQTGSPFEFDSADAIGYHDEAKWLASEDWRTVMQYLFLDRGGYSDSGYPLYLTILYKTFGPSIWVARFFKALFSSISCLLIYRLTSRCINEQVGRMAGVFFMLMPNLIIYCGLHLKETEMLFLIVAFLERTDSVLRKRKNTILDVVLPVLLGGSLFLFRTVLGVVAFFSLITALVFAPNRVMKKGRRMMIAFWVILALVVMAGGAIMNEVEQLWNSRGSNQDNKRLEQTIRGNQWAKYATGGVMAPMVFVLPFSTMVDTGQENQMVIHGGNYVKNFMGIFVLIALYSALFVKKNWRDFSLIGSFVIGYLGVISLSGFANSERFLLPGVPCLIIMWAYGVSILNAKSFRLVKLWYYVVPVMEMGWAFFKIGSRGWM